MQDTGSEKSSSSSGESKSTPIIITEASVNDDNENESYFGTTPPNLTLSHIPSKKKKEDEFRTLFDLQDDDLIDDFSCAYQNKSFLLHGRMYISNKNVSFYSNILGRKTSKTIPYESIVAIYKKNTAIVFANAIEIVTQSGKYFFTSFMFRDNAYKLLTQVWADFVNENSSSGESRVLLKSDGAELFTRHPENENVIEDSEEERSNGSSVSKKKQKLLSAKNAKSFSLKYHTDEEDETSSEYRSDDDSKKSKKKHKKKKSWPTSKYKSTDPTDFEALQVGYVNADKLLQSNGKKEESKAVKKRRESKSATPPINHKKEKEKEKTETPNGVTEINHIKEEDKELNDESNTGLPIKKNCTHIRTEPEKNQTKIFDRTFKVTPSVFFCLTFKNKKFLEEYADSCEYAPEWTADDWAPTDNSECCHSRKLNYKIPLNNNIGPKSTRVIATQYARYLNENSILMEMQNISKDVPFGDSFTVYEIWELKQVEGNKGIKECNIVIKGGISWKKSVWGLKGTIEKKALEGSKSHGEIFLNLAQKYVDNHLKRKHPLISTKTKNGSFDGGKRESLSPQPSEDLSRIKSSRKSSSTKRKPKEKELSSSDISIPSHHPNEMEILLKKISLIIITICMIIVTISMIFMTIRIGKLEKYVDYEEGGYRIEEIREQNQLLRRLLSLLMNTTDIANE